jgi:hypothetical protein
MKLLTITYQILLFSIIFYASCNTKKCNSLQEYFSSEEDGLTQIKSTRFRLSDSTNNPAGSWLTSAYYYSCDGKIGFFVYKLKSNSENFNPGVPITVWNEFKNTSAKDSFYKENIGPKYLRKVKILH